ncbi:MAG: hypothetical protein ABFD97_08175 [Syntrophobacter sp.]
MNKSRLTRKRFLGLNILSGLLICLTLWISVVPLSARDVPPEVKAAAEEGYRSLLESIPPDALSHFNLSNTDEVNQAVLGEGFRVHTIPPESILSYDGKTSVHELILPTQIWFFPVMSRGRIRALLTVDKVGNEYKAVSIGGSGLALQWASALESASSGEDGERVFVRVYQAAADFVVISGAAGTKMAPLGAEMKERLKAAGGATLYDPADIITGLRGPVKMTIDAARSMD